MKVVRVELTEYYSNIWNSIKEKKGLSDIELLIELLDYYDLKDIKQFRMMNELLKKRLSKGIGPMIAFQLYLIKLKVEKVLKSLRYIK